MRLFNLIWGEKKIPSIIKNSDLLSNHAGCSSVYISPHVWEKTRESEMTRALLSKDTA